MEHVKLAVNGTLMRGLPLEKNLLDAGAVFLREAATAPCYRLWSIVYTVEGNSGDSCRQNQYPEGHYEILGYGVPAY